MGQPMHLDCYSKYRNPNYTPKKRKRYAQRQNCVAGPLCLHGGTIDPFTDVVFTRDREKGNNGKDDDAHEEEEEDEREEGSNNSAANALLDVVRPALDPLIQAKIDAKLSDIDVDSLIEEAGEDMRRAIQERKNNLQALETAISSKLLLVDQAIQQKLNSIQDIPRRIEISLPNSANAIDLGIQHKNFEYLLKVCASRINAWVAGPAGSGKTTAAKNVARALNLVFRYSGAVTDPVSLTGYMQAEGKYVRSLFRESYEHGGLFLLDECDASDANALLWLQAAIENGSGAFPDGMVERHKDFVLVAGANTWGHGATAEYVGRNRLDGAFLDRFASVPWDYDHDLERLTAPNLEWTKRVQGIRKSAREMGLKVLVTPRASYYGGALLAAGLSVEQVEMATIGSKMTSEQWNRIKPTDVWDPASSVSSNVIAVA
jgi:cobaltochelatase CobS